MLSRYDETPGSSLLIFLKSFLKDILSESALHVGPADVPKVF